MIYRGITNREAFYFLMDKKGEINKSHGDLFDKGILVHENSILKVMPLNVLVIFNEFINSTNKEAHIEMVSCSDDDASTIDCKIVRKETDEFEMVGYYKHVDVPGQISIDKLPYPIAIVKKDGEIINLNRSFIDYFLESRIVVKPIFIQDIIKTNVYSPEKFDYLKMIESDANSRAVLCHFKGSENNQTFLLNLIPIVSGRKECYLAAVKDLTQFIDVQQNLENQNEELRKQVQEEFEINKAYELKLLKKNRLESLGEIASGIFHELNQPLTHLSLKIDNMLDKWHAGTVTELYLLEKTEQIQRQILRMRGIIDEMKQFSSVPDSKDELVNVQSVLNCALDDISYIQVKGLILVVKHVEEICIKGSSNELEQVFVNILTNSLESLQLKLSANENLKPKLKIAIEQSDELVTITFVDNGLGASEGDLGNIFKPFFTTKKSIGGTGLGLFIINNLMRKMNGTIDVTSKSGNFFKTVLTFPVLKNIEN